MVIVRRPPVQRILQKNEKTVFALFFILDYEYANIIFFMGGPPWTTFFTKDHTYTHPYIVVLEIIALIDAV